MPSVEYVAVYIFQNFCYGFGLASGLAVPFYFLAKKVKALG